MPPRWRGSSSRAKRSEALGRYRIIPLFLPFAGCPGRCAFCAARSLSPDPYLEPEELARRAELLLSKLDPADPRPVQLALYGGSVTALPRPRLASYLGALAPLLAGPVSGGFRLSTRPDALGPDLVHWLAVRGVRTVEVGAPSLDDELLKRLDRGHRAARVARAVEELQAAGLEVGLQMMFGLPGETLREAEQSVRRAGDLRPDFLRLHPLLILAGTTLARAWSRGEIRVLDQAAAVRWGAALLEIAEEAGVPVARLGLITAPELRAPGVVLAGPLDPGLRDRAESLRWRGRLLRRACLGGDRWGVHPADLGWAVGPGRRNESALSRRLRRPIRIAADPDTPRGELTRLDPAPAEGA